MTTLREAAQQALKALEKYRHMMFVEAGCRFGDGDAAITALRAALEQQAEPVAWKVYPENDESSYVTDIPYDLIGAYRALPLYTAPPQRQPLTDEEIKKIRNHDQSESVSEYTRNFVRAIEQAHGIF